MEKMRPTYDLEAVKRVLGDDVTLSMTVPAFRSAATLGFDRSGVAAVVRGMTRGMFYKSMTTYGDHRTWQDVYHVPAGRLVLYVKVEADVVTAFRLVSFKEK
jgi:motility quorum-sensing regulator/GCU-specific mRNA interferase toxin